MLPRIQPHPSASSSVRQKFAPMGNHADSTTVYCLGKTHPVQHCVVTSSLATCFSKKDDVFEHLKYMLEDRWISVPLLLLIFPHSCAK